jgi:hypothetical protein
MTDGDVQKVKRKPQVGVILEESEAENERSQRRAPY